MTKIDSKPLDTAPQPSVVHVSLPANVANNLESFQRVQKDILGRLGCQACCSGWDIRWDVFRNYRVDAKLNVDDATPGF